MRSVRSGCAAALAAAALALAPAACGHAAAPVTSSASSTPSPTATYPPRDTSTPAKALIGHWKDADGADQYFDGSVWATVTAGGEKWKYGYTVLSENAARRWVRLNTYAFQAGGGTKSEAQDITFTFLDKAYAQIQWGVGGLTADYVDGQTRP